ncbi:MAG: leucine-rich repeat domain-containing protein [Treponema sp.]|jgi:hypothetical protein|nr:leucine-rich repeat domain-containing protein [Treponema sp.]
MKKRFFAAAGALFMAATLFSQNAADFEYEAGNGEVTITDYMGSATNVTIPEQINNLPVTVIGDYAFSDNRLTGVTIPHSVTVIGMGAFAYNQLTAVTIPGSVTIIGGGAFADNQLTRVTIPANVDMSVSSFNSLLYVLYTTNDRKAAVYAFSRSKDGDFDSLVCNNTVEIAGYHGKAAELALPEKINGLPVVAIGAEAFAKNHLTSVTIPGSVTVIGEMAFADNR